MERRGGRPGGGVLAVDEKDVRSGRGDFYSAFGKKQGSGTKKWILIITTICFFCVIVIGAIVYLNDSRKAAPFANRAEFLEAAYMMQKMDMEHKAEMERRAAEDKAAGIIRPRKKDWDSGPKGRRWLEHLEKRSQGVTS